MTVKVLKMVEQCFIMQQKRSQEDIIALVKVNSKFKTFNNAQASQNNISFTTQSSAS